MFALHRQGCLRDELWCGFIRVAPENFLSRKINSGWIEKYDKQFAGPQDDQYWSREISPLGCKFYIKNNHSLLLLTCIWIELQELGNGSHKPHLRTYVIIITIYLLFSSAEINNFRNCWSECSASSPDFEPLLILGELMRNSYHRKPKL